MVNINNFFNFDYDGTNLTINNESFSGISSLSRNKKKVICATFNEYFPSGINLNDHTISVLQYDMYSKDGNSSSPKGICSQIPSTCNIYIFIEKDVSIVEIGTIFLHELSHTIHRIIPNLDFDMSYKSYEP